VPLSGPDYLPDPDHQGYVRCTRSRWRSWRVGGPRIRAPATAGSSR